MCIYCFFFRYFVYFFVFFFFQAEDGIRDGHVTGVQTCALPISSWIVRNHRSTRSGRCLRTIQLVATVTIIPINIPMIGDRKMNATGFVQPPGINATKPAFATAAPPYPPISACDELVGSPRVSVIRFQPMAPNSPASRTFWSTISMCTIPLPIVFATAVPNTNAAMKFQNAAHTTARNGVSTRVDTTVAMEFAASCQPFENSNARLSMITAISRSNGFTWSGALQHYAFYHIGDIFALIDGCLDNFKNLFPLDDLNRIGFFIEELSDQCAAETITFILKTIDFNRVSESLIPILDCVYQCSHFGTSLLKNLGEVGRPVSHRVHSVV